MTRFRPDVEGLRAVAIAVVVLSHARLGVAGGGFVGVDVFFVISGFLITQLLVAELDRSGRVAIARFYARRVKRLLPQLLAVIGAVVVAAWLLLSPLQAETVGSDVVAAGAYAMNWHLSPLGYTTSGSVRSSASRSTSAVMRVSSASSRSSEAAGCSNGSTIPAGRLHRPVSLRRVSSRCTRPGSRSSRMTTADTPGSNNLPCP